MLDDTKLADHPTAGKAASRLGNGWTFGTLLTLARGQVTAPGTYTVMENVRPDLFQVYEAAQKGRLDVPRQWSVQRELLVDSENVADFYALWFHVPHGIEALQPKEGLPTELLTLMLSGFLQLGGQFNFKSFQGYLSGRGLKFLPLVITPYQYRYFVYLPTAERVDLAVERFLQVLADLEGLSAHLGDFIEDAYALVRLDEVFDRDVFHIRLAELEIEARLYHALAPYEARLGYLFQDLPGSQDAAVFRYDMYSK